MADFSHTEEEIVALLKEKDIRGMQLLYNKYAAALYGFIYKQVPAPDAAEEVLQEVFVQTWQQIKTFQPKHGGLYGWLLQKVRMLAAEKTRTVNIDPSQNQPVSNKPVVLEEDTVLDPQDIGLPEVTAILRREQKELLDLVFFNGYTPAEAASRLKMPLGTVKTRIHSVILELRKLFQLA